MVNRVIEQGLPAYLLRELDLVVFPHRVGGDRYVAQVVELLSASEYEGLSSEAKRSPTGNPRHGGAGVVEKGETTVHYNTVAWRDTEGRFRLAGDPSDESTGPAATGSASTGPDRRLHAFSRLADRTDRDVDAVEAEFARKHRYVQYLVRDAVDDFDDLFEFLADLRTDEAATVERAARTMDRGGRQ